MRTVSLSLIPLALTAASAVSVSGIAGTPNNDSAADLLTIVGKGREKTRDLPVSK